MSIMYFPSHVDKCLGDFPLEKIMIYIEKYLIDMHVMYNIIRQSDIIIKIRDDNINQIFENLIKKYSELFSGENVILGQLTIHELETDTMISFAYYEELL